MNIDLRLGIHVKIVVYVGNITWKSLYKATHCSIRHKEFRVWSWTYLFLLIFSLVNYGTKLLLFHFLSRIIKHCYLFQSKRILLVIHLTIYFHLGRFTPRNIYFLHLDSSYILLFIPFFSHHSIELHLGLFFSYVKYFILSNFGGTKLGDHFSRF